ncbi:hypothetical protein Lal_00049454 [Lupinus albus]|nr:hypothetical protein Lal_00049454 [Lupinus albus]
MLSSWKDTVTILKYCDTHLQIVREDAVTPLLGRLLKIIPQMMMKHLIKKGDSSATAKIWEVQYLVGSWTITKLRLQKSKSFNDQLPSLAELQPRDARSCDNGIYRAIDTYLKFQA